jgi:hypothetical protein
MISFNTLVELARVGVQAGDHLWYTRARTGVDAFADAHHFDRRAVADIVALLSPRVHVRRNVRLAQAYVRRRSLDGVMKGVRSSVAHWEATGKIRGLKTGPFARALQGDENAVVLDTHMAKLFGVDQKVFATKRGVAEWSAVIRAVADYIGITPAQCQAALWGAHLRSQGKTPTDLRMV